MRYMQRTINKSVFSVMGHTWELGDGFGFLCRILYFWYNRDQGGYSKFLAGTKKLHCEKSK